MRGQVAQESADARIGELAATQHGVVGRRQLREIGLSADQVDRRVAANRLHGVHRGVYAVGHRVLSREGTWMAAVLACGDGAVLSHRDAPALWGVRGKSSAVIDVTVVARSGRKRREGLRLHRAPLPPEEVTVRDGIPATTLARTLLDLAAVVPFEAVKRGIEQAERLRLFDLEEVETTLERNAGRAGTRTFARALREYEEPAFTRSDLERLLLGLCRQHRLPAPAVNAAVAGYEVDFLWRERRLVVETDGRQDHLTPLAFEEDRVRDTQLMLGGYRVLRFTYRQLRYKRNYVVDSLKRALQAEPSISSTR